MKVTLVISMAISCFWTINYPLGNGFSFNWTLISGSYECRKWLHLWEINMFHIFLSRRTVYCVKNVHKICKIFAFSRSTIICTCYWNSRANSPSYRPPKLAKISRCNELEIRNWAEKFANVASATRLPKRGQKKRCKNKQKALLFTPYKSNIVITFRT